jgi:DNA-binding response OmpR family regulator
MVIVEGLPPTILLVEDDSAVADMLVDRLGSKGYRVWRAESAAEAKAALEKAAPDLVILDLTLPDTSGLVFCADLQARPDIPIIICSGTPRKEDAVLGLKLGADDFVAKPFSVDELEARVEAVLRRVAPRSAAAGSPPPTRHQVGELVVDEERCRATLGGEKLPLTPTEYRLLSLSPSVRTPCIRGVSLPSGSGATTMPAWLGRSTCTCAACVRS